MIAGKVSALHRMNTTHILMDSIQIFLFCEGVNGTCYPFLSFLYSLGGIPIILLNSREK